MEEFKTKLERRLDEHLAKALAMQPFTEGNVAPNLLLEGETGTAKTEITQKWAKENGIKLFEINVSLWVNFPKNMNDIYYVGEESIRALSEPKTVLFLDNYDLGTEKCRLIFSSLVERHVLSTVNGDLFLPNILFAIAAAWPIPELHTLVESPLTDAEKQKFERYTIECDKEEHLHYLNDVYNDCIELAKEKGNEEFVKEYKGRIALANCILRDERFVYTSLESLKEDYEKAEERRAKPKSKHGLTTYASFNTCLLASDGSKKSFLKEWDSCFVEQAQKPIIEEILRDYKDVTD